MEEEEDDEEEGGGCGDLWCVFKGFSRFQTCLDGCIDDDGDDDDDDDDDDDGDEDEDDDLLLPRSCFSRAGP